MPPHLSIMTHSQHIKSISNLVLSMHDTSENKQRVANKRSPMLLQAKLFEKSREGRHESQFLGIPMKRVRVHSNFARDRVIILGNGQLVLSFDAHGDATMPEHMLHLLRAEMRAKPGRYTVMSEAPSEVKDQIPLTESSEEVAKQVQTMLSMMKSVEEVEEKPAEEVKAEVIEVITEVPKAEETRPSRRSRKKKVTEKE